MDAKMQQQYAETFRGLHRKGDPLVLFNAWDVATAKAIAKASSAIATSSGAVASALGYADGENVPLDEQDERTARPVQTVKRLGILLLRLDVHRALLLIREN